MYLLYVDESGNHADASDHFVVGGIAVHEAAVVPLQRAVEAAIERRLDPHLRTLEIHAQHMRTGKGPWRGLPKDVRTELLDDVVRAVISLRRRRPHDLALFAAVHAPGAVADADTLERTFEEQLLRFTQMLYRYNPGAREPRGLVIADRARYETELQPIARRWRESGTRFTRLTRLVEVPLFVDSHLARLVQVADVVAHVVYRRYRDGVDPLFESLLPAFDAQDGVLHGLVHLTPGARSCTCPACLSRRAPRRPRTRFG